MTTTFIPVSRAEASKLVAPNPPKKTKGKSGVEYTRTYFQYNYGTAGQARTAQPFFELKKVSASLKKTVSEEGRVQWKLNFQVEDPEDLAGLAELDMGIRQTVFKYKGQFKQFSFSVENPGDLRGCYFLPRTEAGDLIDGSSPIMSLKVDGESFFKRLIPHYDNAGNLMVDANGHPKFEERAVDYKILENTRFECGIIFKLRDLYYGGNGMPLPQLFVGTCWILSEPTQKGSIDYAQSSVIQDFLSSRTPEELDALSSKITNMKIEQNENVLTRNSLPESAPEPSAIAQKSTTSGQTIDLSSYMQNAGQPQQQPTWTPPQAPAQQQWNPSQAPVQQQWAPPQAQQQPPVDLSAYMQSQAQQQPGTVVHSL